MQLKFSRKIKAPRWRSLLIPAILTLAAALLLSAWFWAPVPAPASVPPEKHLEDLQYRVDVLLWEDVARVRLTLTSLEPGRYQAEVSGKPLGWLKLLAGSDRLDSYRTEMIWRGGRFVPLIYREESNRGGKRSLKEYRFDYDRGRLELWQLKEGHGLVRKWQTDLKSPIQDPLSAFYNCRLGLLGPLQDGKTFRVDGIPYPKPEKIEVRIGPKTAEGRKTMITISNSVFANDRGVIFAYFDGHQVPRHGWTRVLKIGKISGELLPGGKPLHERLPEMAGAAAAK
jgi:hypothetical protein